MNKERTHILVVDDEEIVRESLSGWLAEDGYRVEVAPDGPSAIDKVKESRWSIMLVDLKMPGMDGLQVLEEVHRLRPEIAVVIMTAYATVATAVSAMRLGAFDYLVKPFEPEEVSLMIQKIVAQQALVRETTVLRKVIRREHRFRDLVSKSPAMQSLFTLARAAARSQSTVLVLGESGTGKEVLARAIHLDSARADKPFVAVSCAALPDSLLESELFGHERGSFTGAVARRVGKFEAANGGTLFLDEIGDISAKLQLDLLRVLEDRRFFRVGGTDAVTVDVRIIAATNRDLQAEVQQGRFREDLYYRLNVIPIVLPPLRERRADIPLLVEQLLEQLCAEQNRHISGLSAETMALLVSHDWPGNIRELRNVLERAIVVAQGSVLQVSELGLAPKSETELDNLGPLSLEEVERRHIANVLRHADGNVSQAARILGIDRVTLYNKMRKYQLKRPNHDSQETARPTRG